MRLGIYSFPRINSPGRETKIPTSSVVTGLQQIQFSRRFPCRLGSDQLGDHLRTAPAEEFDVPAETAGRRLVAGYGAYRQDLRYGGLADDGGIVLRGVRLRGWATTTAPNSGRWRSRSSTTPYWASLHT